MTRNGGKIAKRKGCDIWIWTDYSTYFFYFIAELDGEQRRLGDATKNLRKCERGIKELTFRQDEDRKNNERMQELVDKLQQQVRTYKR